MKGLNGRLVAAKRALADALDSDQSISDGTKRSGIPSRVDVTEPDRSAAAIVAWNWAGKWCRFIVVQARTCDWPSRWERRPAASPDRITVTEHK